MSQESSSNIKGADYDAIDKKRKALMSKFREQHNLDWEANLNWTRVWNKAVSPGHEPPSGKPGETIDVFEVPEPLTPLEETLQSERSKSFIESDSSKDRRPRGAAHDSSADGSSSDYSRDLKKRRKSKRVPFSGEDGLASNPEPRSILKSKSNLKKS